MRQRISDRSSTLGIESSSTSSRNQVAQCRAARANDVLFKQPFMCGLAQRFGSRRTAGDCGEVSEQALPLSLVAAHEAEVTANTLEMNEAGFLVLRVLGDEYRQETELRRQHLENGGGHITRIGKEVATPAQRAELHTEAELVGWSRQRSTCSRSAIVRLKYLRRSAVSISAGSRSAASTTSGSSTSPWVLTCGGSVTASARRAQCTQVVVAERAHTGLGIDLGGRESQVAKELLHLVDRHVPGVEQDRRDRVPQEMRVHTLRDACLPRTRGDHGLDGANGIMRVSVALEEVAMPPCKCVRNSWARLGKIGT